RFIEGTRGGRPAGHVMAVSPLSEPDALMRGHSSMLAPLIIDLLIASLLFLLAGWVSDALRASAHDGQSCLDSERPTGRTPMSRPRRPRPCDDGDGTWGARPVRRRQPPGRLPSYPLSIGRLLPHGPEPRMCHDSVA